MSQKPSEARKVILYKNTGIHDLLRTAKSHGGPAANAVKKVYNARTAYEIEGKIGLPTTNNGESRIAGAIKYDLSNGYRLVTLQHGSVCIFLYFGNHDSTQSWLDKNRNLKVTLDPKDNKISLVFSKTRDEIGSPDPTIANVPYLQRLEKANWNTIIENFGIRKYLLGINEDTTEEEIFEVIDEVQKDSPELSGLLTTLFGHLQRGKLSDAQAALNHYLGESKDITSSFGEELTAEVISSPSNSEDIINLTELSEDEWEKILDPTRFQEWMVFLHPSQKRVVDEDHDLPCVLTGVSGSGKTCVLAHRAKKLAEESPNERILILTLNRSLSRLIRHLVNQLVSEELATRIDVRSFHGYLADMLGSLDIGSFLADLGQYLEIEDAVTDLVKNRPPEQLNALFKAREETELMDSFKDFLNKLEEPLKSKVSKLEIYMYNQNQSLDFSQYLYEELELVRSAFPCYDGYKEYMSFERTGRSIQFQEGRKQVILELLKAWQAYQVQSGFLDHMMLCQTALLAVDEKNSIPSHFQYRSVLIDEFQDFSTLDLQVISKIPTTKTNGLFLTGDFAQKLFTKELSFPKANLGPKQRSLRSIRKNYRNSRQILLAADSLIKAYPPTFTKDESSSILEPEYAVRESAKPISLKCPSDPVPTAWHNVVEWLTAGHAPFSVCIASADLKNFPLDDIEEATPKHLNSIRLSGDYKVDLNKVIISDLQSVKGFEFSLIIVIGLEDKQFPSSGRMNKEHWRDALRLYVAITRARDEARLLYKNIPSPFLKAMDQHLLWLEADVISEPEEKLISISEEQTSKSDSSDKTTKINLPTDKRLQKTRELSSPQSEDLDSENKYTVSVLNGMTFMTVPQKMSQLQISKALNVNLVEIALFCQHTHNLIVTPQSVLTNHIIESVFKRYNIHVAFQTPNTQ